MSTYFVDYENTSLKGLAGVENLSKEDTVIVFYGKNTGSISFDEHVRVSSASASIRYIKTEKVGKNYLDFQLATYCGFIISTSDDKEFYIVSKDTGYDSVIDFWRTMNPFISLKRITQIIEGIREQEESITPLSLYMTSTTVGNAESTMIPKRNTGTTIHKGKSASEKIKSAPRKTVKSSGGKLPEKMKKKIRILIKEEQLKGASYNQIYTSIMSCNDKQNFHNSLYEIFKPDLGTRIYKAVLPVYEEYHQEQTAVV